MKLKMLSRLFLKNERGYVAAAFAILALPVLAIIGGAVDYRNIGREYANLRAAAEAAAVGVARSQFKPVRTGHDEPDENPLTLMQSIFNANFADDSDKYTYVTPTLTYVDPDEKAVTVTAKAGVKTILLQIIGFDVYDLSVEAKAGAIFSTENVQINFVIDWSPSMGAPADGTAPPLNADGCYFMCHDTGATIRAAGKTPKMDVINDRLTASDGFIAAVEEAVASNPIPITVDYYRHYFDQSVLNQDEMKTAAQMRALLSSYVLGLSGGGTDFNRTFEYMHDYFIAWTPANTRRVIIVISDGMHSRASKPYDPAFCNAMKGDGDVFTLYVNNPESVYDNPNLDTKVPDLSMLSRDSWDWSVLRNGSNISTPAGYYSGLNNASKIMKNCASKESWYFAGETQQELTDAIDAMAQAVTAPEIRVIN